MKMFGKFISVALAFTMMVSASMAVSALTPQMSQSKVLNQHTTTSVLNERTTQETTVTDYDDGFSTIDVLTVTELDIPVPYGMGLSRAAKAKRAVMTQTVEARENNGTSRIPVAKMELGCTFFYDGSASGATYNDEYWDLNPLSGTRWRDYGFSSDILEHNNNELMVVGKGKCLTYSSLNTRGIMITCTTNGRITKKAFTAT